MNDLDLENLENIEWRLKNAQRMFSELDMPDADAVFEMCGDVERLLLEVKRTQKLAAAWERTCGGSDWLETLKMSKLECEEGPDVVVGPAIDMSKPGAMDELLTWMLEQHVQLCAKGGIDCRTCERAAEQGINRPA